MSNICNCIANIWISEDSIQFGYAYYTYPTEPHLFWVKFGPKGAVGNHGQGPDGWYSIKSIAPDTESGSSVLKVWPDGKVVIETVGSTKTQIFPNGETTLKLPPSLTTRFRNYILNMKPEYNENSNTYENELTRKTFFDNTLFVLMNSDYLADYLRSGGKANDRDPCGFSLLFAAVKYNYHNLVKRLLDAGASIYDKQPIGKTILEFVQTDRDVVLSIKKLIHDKHKIIQNEIRRVKNAKMYVNVETAVKDKMGQLTPGRNFPGVSQRIMNYIEKPNIRPGNIGVANYLAYKESAGGAVRGTRKKSLQSRLTRRRKIRVIK